MNSLKFTYEASYFVAAITLIVGIWTASSGTGVALVVAGALMLFCAALQEDVVTLHNENVELKAEVKELRKWTTDAEQRLQVVELFRRRIDARIVEEELNEGTPVPQHPSLDT